VNWKADKQFISLPPAQPTSLRTFAQMFTLILLLAFFPSFFLSFFLSFIVSSFFLAAFFYGRMLLYEKERARQRIPTAKR
jgi:hypothetical protein